MPDNPPAKSLHDLLNDVWITARIGDEWEECYDAVARFHQEAIERERKTANAWRDYAEHQEWCRYCAEDGTESCDKGRELKQIAISTTPLPEGEN